MRFTVLRSKAVQVTDEHQFPLENYMPTTRQWDFKTQVHCFSRLFKRSNHRRFLREGFSPRSNRLPLSYITGY